MPSKKTTKKWAVIRFWQGNEKSGYMQGDTLCRMDPNRMDKVYWSNGISYMTVHSNLKLEVVEWYPFRPSSHDTAWLKFYLDHPLVPIDADKHPEASDGWLSPQGTFYPCDYGAHDATARYLSAQYYKKLDGEISLERYGWAKVFGRGLIRSQTWGERRELKLTEVQEDTLRKLATVGDEEWQYGILQAIELYGSKQ